MVSKRKVGRPKKNGTNTEEVDEEETQNESNNGEMSGYEQFRDQRVKENMERMEKLGIIDLSRKLKSHILPSNRRGRPLNTPSQKKSPLPPSGSPRRSSRLKSMPQVSYFERRFTKEEVEKLDKNVEIYIKEGSKPEIYTEEQEKLLGDCNTTWTLFVDGYDEDRQRIYDQLEGKTCHQCRQKTLGRHTDCCNCKLVQGQLCGDCLYMRYGENVIEANGNPGWTCPACRGICNCSRCRRQKGWAPTGAIYRKVLSLGFRSVAHYLIQRKHSQINQEEPAGENPTSPKRSLSLADRQADLSDVISKSHSDDNRDEKMEDNEHDHSDKRDDGNQAAAAAAANDDDDDYDAVDDDELSDEDD